MDENAELLKEIAAFCIREEIAESTFGLRAVNDGKLVSRLRDGSTITMRVYRKVRAQLDAKRAKRARAAA